MHFCDELRYYDPLPPGSAHMYKCWHLPGSAHMYMLAFVCNILIMTQMMENSDVTNELRWQLMLHMFGKCMWLGVAF